MPRNTGLMTDVRAASMAAQMDLSKAAPTDMSEVSLGATRAALKADWMAVLWAAWRAVQSAAVWAVL